MVYFRYASKTRTVLAEIIRVGRRVFDHAGDVIAHDRVEFGIEQRPNFAPVRVERGGQAVGGQANLESRRDGHGLCRIGGPSIDLNRQIITNS